MASTLVVNRGKHRLVTPTELYAIETPPRTNSHVPIAHTQLLEACEELSTQYGLKIQGATHAVSNNGQKYFGVLDIANSNANCPGDTPDFQLAIGLRNSHDKSLSVGLCIGSRVMVCSNLAFSGDIQLFRKHTSYVERDLRPRMEEALGRVSKIHARQIKQFACYKAEMLNDLQARHLLVECVKRGVIGSGDVLSVLAQWEAPTYAEFDRPNLWRFFNAVTTIGKKWVPETLRTRTQALYNLCNLRVTTTQMMAA